MFGWFRSKEVDALADSLVDDLRRILPPSGKDSATAKDARRLNKQFGAIFARLDAFLAAHDLSLYAKARLGNRIKWALKGAGYPEPLIEEFTRELAIHAAVVRRKPAKGQDRR